MGTKAIKSVKINASISFFSFSSVSTHRRPIGREKRVQKAKRTKFSNIWKHRCPTLNYRKQCGHFRQSILGIQHNIILSHTIDYRHFMNNEKQFLATQLLNSLS